jgi:hypothetical protein
MFRGEDAMADLFVHDIEGESREPTSRRRS